MAESHSVQRCRWAAPTLFQKSPLWLQADEYPWSCGADGEMKPVVQTKACESCDRWASRAPSPEDGTPPVTER